MCFKKNISIFVVTLIFLFPYSSWSITNVLGDKITIIGHPSIDAEVLRSQDKIDSSDLPFKSISIWPRVKDGFALNSKPSKKAKKIRNGTKIGLSILKECLTDQENTYFM